MYAVLWLYFWFALCALSVAIVIVVVKRFGSRETKQEKKQSEEELQFVIMGTHSGFSLSLGIVCWSTPASGSTSSSSTSSSTSNIA